jgi:hypothetical protein
MLRYFSWKPSALILAMKSHMMLAASLQGGAANKTNRNNRRNQHVA